MLDMTEEEKASEGTDGRVGRVERMCALSFEYRNWPSLLQDHVICGDSSRVVAVP